MGSSVARLCRPWLPHSIIFDKPASAVRKSFPPMLTSHLNKQNSNRHQHSHLTHTHSFTSYSHTEFKREIPRTIRTTHYIFGNQNSNWHCFFVCSCSVLPSMLITAWRPTKPARLGMITACETSLQMLKFRPRLLPRVGFDSDKMSKFL